MLFLGTSMQTIRPVFRMSIIVILDQKIEQIKHNNSFICSFSECLLNPSNYNYGWIYPGTQHIKCTILKLKKLFLIWNLFLI